MPPNNDGYQHATDPQGLVHWTYVYGLDMFQRACCHYPIRCRLLLGVATTITCLFCVQYPLTRGDTQAAL